MNIYSCIDSKNIDKILSLFNSIIINFNDDDIKLKFFLLVDTFDNLKIPNYFDNILFIKEFKLDSNWKKLMNQFNDSFYVDVPWCKNNMNFARFFIFNHFPQINRAIYLDWDMVVLSDISKLINEYKKTDKIVVSQLEIDQTVFTASFNNTFKYGNNINSIYTNKVSDKIKLHGISKILENLNIEYNDIIKNKSFNAGFFIVSKDHFDTNELYNFVDILIKIQISMNCFNFGTQTILNLLKINDKTFVSKEWNYIPYLTDEENIDINNINIIHWNGCNKPWESKKGINKIWWAYYNKYLEMIENKHIEV